MDTMLANDCQDLLFKYINNILAGGTPLFNLWNYGGEVTLIFCYVLVATHFSTTHLLQIMVKMLMVICCEKGD